MDTDQDQANNIQQLDDGRNYSNDELGLNMLPVASSSSTMGASTTPSPSSFLVASSSSPSPTQFLTSEPFPPPLNEPIAPLPALGPIIQVGQGSITEQDVPTSMYPFPQSPKQSINDLLSPPLGVHKVNDMDVDMEQRTLSPSVMSSTLTSIPTSSLPPLSTSSASSSSSSMSISTSASTSTSMSTPMEVTTSSSDSTSALPSLTSIIMEKPQAKEFLSSLSPTPDSTISTEVMPSSPQTSSTVMQLSSSKPLSPPQSPTVSSTLSSPSSPPPTHSPSSSSNMAISSSAVLSQASPKPEVSSPPLPPAFKNCCIRCSSVLGYPANAKLVRCPVCLTVNAVDSATHVQIDVPAEPTNLYAQCRTWTSIQVAVFVRSLNCSAEAVQMLLRNHIDGFQLLDLCKSDLLQIGLRDEREIEIILNAANIIKHQASS